MPDLFAIVGALKDEGYITQNEMTELCGTTMRPQYREVLAVLVEKKLLTQDEKDSMKIPDLTRLCDLLALKGVLKS